MHPQRALFRRFVLPLRLSPLRCCRYKYFPYNFECFRQYFQVPYFDCFAVLTADCIPDS